MRIASALSFLLFSVLLASGQTPPKPAPAPASAAARKAAKPDAQIEASIRAKFEKSKINEDHFTVKVSSGVATIDGKTNVIQHKGVATRLAKNGGAVEVHNRIEIGQAAREKARDNLEKGRKRAQIVKR